MTKKIKEIVFGNPNNPERILDRGIFFTLAAGGLALVENGPIRPENPYAIEPAAQATMVLGLTCFYLYFARAWIAETNLKDVKQGRLNIVARPNWVDDPQTPQEAIDKWYAEMAAQGKKVI